MSSLDDNFGSWLQIIMPSFSVDERDSRLSVIRKLASAVTEGDVISLVLMFYQSKPDGSLADRFRASMRNVDPGFIDRNDAELAVMAAGVLYELLDRGGAIASAIALALMCAEFGALSGNARVDQVVNRASSFLMAEGVRIREQKVQLPDLQQTLKGIVEEPEDEESEKENEKPLSTGDADSPVLGALQRVVDALGEYGASVSSALQAMEGRRAEESNILYWLLSGRKRIDDQLLNELKKQNAAVAIALELAELTSQIPGPASAAPILLSLLEQCKDSATEATIEECVASVTEVEGNRYTAALRTIHPLITPMIYALEKSKENGWKKGWKNAFETQTKVAPSKKRPVVQITEQVYREALLFRALGARS